VMLYIQLREPYRAKIQAVGAKDIEFPRVRSNP